MRALKTMNLAVAMLAIGSISGCGGSKVQMPSGSVWRASNNNGDKPGNGIELRMEGQLISGSFYLLEPEKPHNFEAGESFPIVIRERRATQLECDVKFNPELTISFALKLPDSFPDSQFVATVIDHAPNRTPIEFVFKRVR